VERTDLVGVNVNEYFIPYVFPGVGSLLIFLGVMAAGTSQVLRYDSTKDEISYSSTVAMLSGYDKTFSTKNLLRVVYNLHKVTHRRHRRHNEKRLPSAFNDSMREVHTTWDGAITLWYEGNYNEELPKISHSEALEKGLKEIAKAIGADYERHELAEKREGLM